VLGISENEFLLSMLKPESSKISITDLFKSDLQLTSPPALFFALKRIIEDPNKSMADAGNVITNDPALTMRLLKFVRSPYYGFSGRISTVTQAISIIGSKELQNLVLATLIISKFTGLPDGMMTMQDFWAMSLRNALTAKELAVALHCHKGDMKESIFICGLLHEIGKLVFYRQIPELAREIGLLVEQTGEAEIDAEQKVLGFNHYDAGSELARLWNLPAVIPETIAQHCQPDNSSPYCLISDIIRSASLISKMDLSNLSTDLSKWGISNDELSLVVENANNHFDEIFSIFYPSSHST
jgi:HD-like signal output (HDOD) protein